MRRNPLPAAYRGDSYQFTLRFPDASFLAGAPGNVLAQVRTSADAVDPPAATWDVAVDDDGVSLIMSMEAVDLDAGSYVTDVQVGDTTWLRQTCFEVLPDVSRP